MLHVRLTIHTALLSKGQDLLQDLQRRRTYDGSSVVALMRAMRNKVRHSVLRVLFE